MRTLLPRKLVGPLALLLTACGVFAAPTPSIQADGLPKFTGYTLPGSLGEPMKPAEGKPIVREERTGLGVSVLYSVYDRADGRPGDIWNTGVKGLEDAFVAGKDGGGQIGARKLDTNARYLYLYQVIHDSGRESVVKTATIRLLVDPQLITSWGYFVTRKPEGKPGEEVPGVGIGFAQPVVDPKINKGVAVELPISTEHPVVKDRKYSEHSPYFLAPKPYRTSHIDVDNKIKDIVADPTGAGENVGRAPEEVMLLSSATFDGPPKLHPEALRAYGAGYLGDSTIAFPGVVPSGFASPYYAPFAPLPSLYAPARRCTVTATSAAPFWGAPSFGPFIPPITVVGAAASTGPGTGIRGVATEEDRNRSPAIRAFWLDKPLQPGERSTLFGFTSDYPPVYEDARVRGNSKLAIGAAIGFGDPDLRTAALTADGEVPTPIAFERAAAAPATSVGFGGGFGGTLGGTTGGGGGFGGGGGALPAFGGGLSGAPPGGGGGGTPSGGGGGGTPSTSGGSNSSPTQAQTQSPTTTSPTTVTTPTASSQNNTPAVTSQASALTQEQQQQQQQRALARSSLVPVLAALLNSRAIPATSAFSSLVPALAALLNSRAIPATSQFSSPVPALAALLAEEALNANSRTPIVNVTTPVTQIDTNTQSQQQQQKQQQQQQQQQKQQQQQQQKQSVHQHQHHMPPAVVPEPAAVIAALLGLPAFLLFARRRKTLRPDTQDNAEVTKA